MNKHLLTLLMALGLSFPLLAQSKVVIRVDSVITQTNDPLVCVPVIADSFPNNIAAMEFSIKWDGNAIDFAEARFGDNPFDFSANDARLSSRDPSSFVVAYVTATTQGIEIAPSTTMFELCFSREGRPEASSPFYFNGPNAPEFADENTLQPQPFDTIPGLLTYTEGTTGVFAPTATEPAWGSRLNIFPNPYTYGPLTIGGDRLPRFESVNVFDMEGRSVRHFVGDVNKLDLSTLPKGEYALQIIADGRAVTRSVIKH